MDKSQILDLMVAQHALIDTLFSAVRDEIKVNSAAAKSFLSELTWEVKKHFFVEEQAIFNLLPWKEVEISELVSRLKKEHIFMTATLEKVMEGLVFEDEEGFSKIMKNHVEIEEQKLYPLLDEKLTDEEKRLIIARVNQIPMNRG